jgi:NAD(P)-dependent dehydrogenase (short-subunit alcohol dehydrogenase family)
MGISVAVRIGYQTGNRTRLRRLTGQLLWYGIHDMDYKVKGKLAYVAAGAHGIGEAVANLLTQEGAAVIVADKDEAALNEKSSCWAGVFAADLATAGGVEEAVSYVLKSFGRAPDILINNLGVGEAAVFEDISDERWAQSIDINLMGFVRTCRALLPGMAKLGSAAVVNTLSDLAKQPEPALMDYGRLQGRPAVPYEGAGAAIRPESTGKRGLARADLDGNVVASGRDRGSTRNPIRTSERSRAATVPGGPANAARDGATRGCRTPGGVFGVSAGKVHHGGGFGHWGNDSRANLM